ncbi:MAG: UxaA family hydrolase, partial [Clostridia bacterium]|nr:UxaA family hydrolase [Clostridia bacterium]
MQTFIKLNDRDNVAIVVKPMAAGSELMPGVITLADIPQGHKVALCDIPKDGEIIRYGVTLGYALDEIPKGSWINEHMLRLPVSPSLDNMPWGTNLRTDLPEPPVKTWWGYKNPEGGYAGTRNILGIQTTVQCVQGVLDVAVERIRKELLPKYPNVDDVVAVNHAYGCG